MDSYGDDYDRRYVNTYPSYSDWWYRYYGSPAAYGDPYQTNRPSYYAARANTALYGQNTGTPPYNPTEYRNSEPELPTRKPREPSESGKRNTRAAVAVVVLLLIVAAAIATAVYFGVTNSNTGPAPAGDTLPMVGLLVSDDWQYVPELEDPDSVIYKAYAGQLCSEIADALSTAGLLPYAVCDILRFTEGSVVAEFRIEIPRDLLKTQGQQETETRQALVNHVTATVGLSFQDPGNRVINVDFCSRDDAPLSLCEQLCDTALDVDSPQCDCYDGFQLMANGYICIDVDECVNNDVGCAQTCKNVDGGFRCECEAGYDLAADGTTCLDIDECATDNGGCQGSCENTPGSYVCRCPDGYHLADNGRDCEDTNECRPDLNSCSQLCINQEGNYSCDCQSGFLLHTDGRTCNDIDECLESPCGTNVTCTNTDGSFVCSCEANEILLADGKTCVEFKLILTDQTLSPDLGDTLSTNCYVFTDASLVNLDQISLYWTDPGGTMVPSEILNDIYVQRQIWGGFTAIYLNMRVSKLEYRGTYTCGASYMGFMTEIDFPIYLTAVCSQSEYGCTSGYCLPNSKVCDRTPDCLEREDEAGCGCNANEFQCVDLSSRCIPLDNRCDGLRDCEDWSDEDGCSCESDQWQCDDGRCVPEAALCDGRCDCADGSDETSCTASPTCPPSTFECGGLCYNMDVTCDGRRHCADGSDESDAQCGTFLCSPGDAPLPWSVVCDGTQDCVNNADELVCVPEPGPITCDGGSVTLTLAFWCDKYPDCTDGTDEPDGCATACPAGYVLCSGGGQCGGQPQCIPESQWCDGTQDCSMGEDERNCPCKAYEFECQGPLGKVCVGEDKWCDGEIHCPDKSDEADGCLLECAPNQLKCDGRCLVTAKVCDGVLDCMNGLDESTCECTSTQKRCDMGMCIAAGRFCDFRNDCPDMSDEANCTTPCDGLHECDGKCLSMDLRCDGKIHCTNYSDEQDCNCNISVPRREAQFFLWETQIQAFHANTRCAMGMCLAATRWCNGDVDCPDGSDEVEGCVPGCPDGWMSCDESEPSAGCVPPAYVCDGVAHCRSRVDEAGCDCPVQPLGQLIQLFMSESEIENATWQQCTDGTCLPSNYFCDGKRDCLDASDESIAVCGIDNCQVDCGDGLCVKTSDLCDRTFDCFTGLDEVGCSYPCLSDSVRCGADGPCVHESLWCDGTDNCPNAEDEAECPTACAADEMPCPGTGFCKPAAKFCDRENDCGDYSDEFDCTCDDDEYKCTTSQLCVADNTFCDRTQQCPDRSDEPASCAEACKPGQIACNGRCVGESEICDGIVNCVDLSDEINCECTSGQFMCATSGICLDIVRWCDGVIHCGDGGDEMANCSTTCPTDHFRCRESGLCLSEKDMCEAGIPCPSLQGFFDCDPPAPIPDDTCGVPAPRPEAAPIGASLFVFDGVEVRPHSWPWVAQLQLERVKNGDQWIGYCAATLISPSWVVTAAHCVIDPPVDRVRVALGEHDLSITEGSEVYRRVRRLVLHPDYNRATDSDDLALLQIWPPVELNDKIRPICLSRENNSPGDVCTLAGWGLTQGTGDRTVLNEVDVPIVSETVCRALTFDTWLFYPNLLAREVCVGTYERRGGVCSGDSGGGLMCSRDGRYVLQGVVSSGIVGCRHPRTFSFLARAPSYSDWIQIHTGVAPVD